MNVDGSCVLVTGGSSGLGRATAQHMRRQGARVLIVDLPGSAGEDAARSLGDKVRFFAADVTDEEQMRAAVDAASSMAPLRAAVHCAGRGGALRILDKEGRPGSLEHFAGIIRTNLVGSFNTLRLVAAAMAQNEPVDGERGVFVLTASVAAYEGQIGQIPYASSKAGVVGMTLVAARDLAQRQIRVCSIAPGLFDTPMLARLPADVRESLGRSVPHPARLGVPDEFARLAAHIVENPMINGETIRLDGAIRMAPR
jgi:NAD(P)-dependent dehydrogenase (short-subunit alcohol dehydrogenase family)